MGQWSNVKQIGTYVIIDLTKNGLRSFQKHQNENSTKQAHVKELENKLQELQKKINSPRKEPSSLNAMK